MARGTDILHRWTLTGGLCAHEVAGPGHIVGASCGALPGLPTAHCGVSGGERWSPSWPSRVLPAQQLPRVDLCVRPGTLLKTVPRLGTDVLMLSPGPLGPCPWMGRGYPDLAPGNPGAFRKPTSRPACTWHLFKGPAHSRAHWAAWEVKLPVRYLSMTVTQNPVC